MKTKLYLGKDFNDERIYLSKHSWDCNWYWGFGYLGNKNMHFHIRSWLTGHQATEWEIHLKDTKLTPANWWVIGDLFKQAYALKECAEAYRSGGHWTDTAESLRAKRDDDLIKRINSDLEGLLNNIWNYIEEAVK